MENLVKLREKIKSKLFDVDWTNPYWIDGIKEKFPEETEETIDSIYFDELKNKINSLSETDLKALYAEQNALTSANQNFLLQELIEEKLGLNV